MGRKSTWKSMTIYSSDDTRALESYWKSSRGAFEKYTWTFDRVGGGGYLETNLPYRYLRQVFSYAGVRLPSDFVTDTMSMEERTQEQ